MEPLFQTESQITYTEYEKYTKALKSEQPFKISRQMVVSIVCLIIAIIMIVTSHKQYALLFVAFAVLTGPLFSMINTFMLGQDYKKNRDYLMETVKFDFYEDYVDITRDGKIAKVNYSNLHKLIETDRNFYLMVTEELAFVVIKDNCSDELIQFLSSKKEQ